jgi:hypothetical protein
MNKRNTLVGPQLQRGRTGFAPDWKRLIAFLVVIVLGSIVATQVLANSYGFHPALGFNLFHVYPPWSYFVWAHQWDHPNNHVLFAQAFGAERTSALADVKTETGHNRQRSRDATTPEPLTMSAP